MKLSSVLIGIGIGLVVGFFLTNLFKSNSQLNNKQTLNIQQADTIAWQWPDSIDAVKAAPNSHKVLFENDKMRILEVTVEPYGFEPMHTHRYPSVMFGPDNDNSRYDIIYYRYGYDSVRQTYFAKDSIRQHGGSGTGTAIAHLMKPEGPHRIKNLSNARILAFRVEFKTATEK